MTEREAAAASARPLPPLPAPQIPYGHVWNLPLAKHDYYTADQVNAIILADRAASAPQAVRMPLTEEQILRTPLDWTVAREIEAAHGIVPLAPQDTGEIK